MAEPEVSDEMFEQISKINRDLDRPIPGQSLTEDPDNPAPYATPPEFTSREKAIEHFMELILDEDNFAGIMGALRSGTEVMTIVELLLTQSFRQGEINPDMMLILAEPLAYLLIGLAERQGFEPTIVDDSDDPVLSEEDVIEQGSPFRNNIKKIKEPKADEELDLDSIIEENSHSLLERGV